MSSPITIEYRGNKMLSINHLYGRNQWGDMYLKSEGRALKNELVFNYGNKRMRQDTELGYSLEIYGNWYNEKKAKTKIKKKDSNNLLKLILDGVCEALDIDDSQFFSEHIVKVQSDQPGFKIEINYL